MKSTMHCRRFLARTGQSGAGLSILANSGSLWGYAANEKLRVALVGVGGRGEWFVDAIPRMRKSSPCAT